MTEAPKLTEAVVLELLRARMSRPGNGGSGEFAFLTHVRSDAAFDAKRTFDAMAVNLWPSRGLVIEVFEVKVSRSDWRRELAKPDKAEDAARVADRFTVVAPVGCVKDGELPPGWGLLEVHGDGDAKPWRLRERTAPRLFDPDVPTKAKPVARGLLVAMLRCCPGAVPGGKLPPAHQSELDAAYANGKAAAEREFETQRRIRAGEAERTVRDAEQLAAAIAEHGVDPWRARLSTLVDHAPAIAAAIKGHAVDRELGYVRRTLEQALAALGPTT